MNSILQCLFSIKKLRDYYINNYFGNSTISNELKVVMDKLKNINESHYSPKKFKEAISKKWKMFDGVKASDAKDLLFHLIDILSSELENGNFEEEEKNNNNIDQTNKIQVYEQELKEVNYNIIINDLFLGFYEVINKCPNNNKNIYTFNKDCYIIFDLEKYQYCNEININKLFLDYEKMQKDSFYCCLCGCEHTNTSYKKIYISPKILIIILDRGKNKIYGNKVIFNKLLIINTDSANYQYYKLISVCTHSGSSSSCGHYTSICLRNNKYYYFSDTNVTETNKLLDDDPYILFYEKIQYEKYKLLLNNWNIKEEEIKSGYTNYFDEGPWKTKNIIKNKYYNDKEDNLIYQRPSTIRKNYENMFRTIIQNKKISKNDEDDFNPKKRKKNISKFSFCFPDVFPEFNTLDVIKDKKKFAYKSDNPLLSLLLQEAMKELNKANNENYNIEYNNSDIKGSEFIWKILMKGPSNTPYEGYTYKIILDFRNGIPKNLAEIVSFETKICHNNIDQNSNKLIYNLDYDDSYVLEWNIKKLLDNIFNLLKNPDLSYA